MVVLGTCHPPMADQAGRRCRCPVAGSPTADDGSYDNRTIGTLKVRGHSAVARPRKPGKKASGKRLAGGMGSPSGITPTSSRGLLRCSRVPSPPPLAHLLNPASRWCRISARGGREAVVELLPPSHLHRHVGHFLGARADGKQTSSRDGKNFRLFFRFWSDEWDGGLPSSRGIWRCKVIIDRGSRQRPLGVVFQGGRDLPSRAAQWRRRRRRRASCRGPRVPRRATGTDQLRRSGLSVQSWRNGFRGAGCAAVPPASCQQQGASINSILGRGDGTAPAIAPSCLARMGPRRGRD